MTRYFGGFINYIFRDENGELIEYNVRPIALKIYTDNITEYINEKILLFFLEYKQKNPTVTDFQYDVVEIE